jgi:hypothetical protein
LRFSFFIHINLLFFVLNISRAVPSEAPFDMEAKLLNETTVLVKWKSPAVIHRNGILKSYNVIVRCVNFYQNISKTLTNVTIDADNARITLVNLTEGVTYTISIAAINRAGCGPYSQPAIIRLDPFTKTLDTSFTYRSPSSDDNDDLESLVMKPWFIVLLGATIVILALSLAMIIFIKKRQAWLKSSSFNGLSGKFNEISFKVLNLHISQRKRKILIFIWNFIFIHYYDDKFSFPQMQF